MRREQFEHLVRAACDAAGVDEIIVIGSQAILGSVPTAPEQMLLSMEIDVFVVGQSPAAEAIDGALGDGSHFHSAYGYYAHGVGPETAVAPEGWMDRLVSVQVERRAGAQGRVTARCMEQHDLVLAKLAAGREHDIDFALSAVLAHLVSIDRLHELAKALPESHRAAVQRLVELVASRAERA
jgi:hypothetical protein